MICRQPHGCIHPSNKCVGVSVGVFVFVPRRLPEDVGTTGYRDFDGGAADVRSFSRTKILSQTIKKRTKQKHR